LDKPILLRDDSGSRSGGGAAHLADEAADRFGMLWKGPDNLTLSIRQTSRMADTFLDCHLAGGVNAIWQEYLGCTRRTLEMSFAHVHEMARCRSPETLIASQADLTVKQVDLTLQSGLWICPPGRRAGWSTHGGNRMAQNNDQATDRPDDGGDDRPATTSQPSGAVREENTGGEPLPGDERLDMDRTPGDGSTPVGLTVKELLKRAEDADDMTQPGTS
jgi:hypothetical protein